MSAMGIDISDRSLKFADLRRENGRFFVRRFGNRIIPEGLIESGQIKNKEKLTNFLRSIRKELRTKFVNVSLPEEKAFLGSINLPKVRKEEIRGALELQLEEHVPISAENAIFDFEVFEIKDKRIKKDSLQVNFVAFPKEMIEDYRGVFVGAGFIPLAFEMEAYAFARVAVPKNEKGPYLIADFGKTRISLAIVSEGKIRFTSTIKIGGDDLQRALIKDLKVDHFRAEEIKKRSGLLRGKESEKVVEAFLPIVAVIKDEIEKHINYWNSHSEKIIGTTAVIKKIILCGGESNLLGLPEHLSYQLKLPVETCNPWVNIVSFEDHVPEIELKESLVYATALGLALRNFEEN